MLLNTMKSRTGSKPESLTTIKTKNEPLLLIMKPKTSPNFQKRPLQHNFHNSKIKALEEINKTDVTPDLKDIQQNVQENPKNKTPLNEHMDE